MDSKRLKKSSRQELLEMLLDATEENERLRHENEELRQEIESRRLICQNTGSLAEAALKLSGIFEAADKALKIYQANLEQSESPTDQSPSEDTVSVSETEELSDGTPEQS